MPGKFELNAVYPSPFAFDKATDKEPELLKSLDADIRAQTAAMMKRQYTLHETLLRRAHDLQTGLNYFSELVGFDNRENLRTNHSYEWGAKYEFSDTPRSRPWVFYSWKQIDCAMKLIGYIKP